MSFEAIELSHAAVSMIEQLFIAGPAWDGDVCSKSGREELVQAGLAFHDNGWCSLTAEGVRVAVGWNFEALSKRRDRRWIQKLRRA